tara:strand:- start:2464 stop:3015 length:552 start_codon:yes stop_codon:yes gene_type:complete
MDYFRKLKDVFVNPNEFFDSTQNETKYGPVFLYLFVTLVIGSVIVLIAGLLGAQSGLSLIMGAIFSPVIVVVNLVVSFIVIPLGLLVQHLFVLMFGGRQGLLRTYQSFIYGGTPGLIFQGIPFLNFVAWIYSLVLSVFALTELQKISTLRAVLSVLVPFIIAAGIVAMALYYIASMFTSISAI